MAGIEVVEVDADEQGRVPVGSVADSLAGQDFRSVFVEGGAAVITSFLRAGLVHRMFVVIAPVIIGRGIEAVGELNILEPWLPRSRERSQEKALPVVRKTTTFFLQKPHFSNAKMSYCESRLAVRGGGDICLPRSIKPPLSVESTHITKAVEKHVS